MKTLAIALSSFLSQASFAETIQITVNKSDLITQKSIDVNFDGSMTVTEPRLKYEGQMNAVALGATVYGYSGSPTSTTVSKESAIGVCRLYGYSKLENYRSFESEKSRGILLKNDGRFQGFTKSPGRTNCDDGGVCYSSRAVALVKSVTCR